MSSDQEQQPSNADLSVKTPSPEDIAENLEKVKSVLVEKQVIRAVKALLKRYRVEKEKSEKKDLFEDEEVEMDRNREIDFEQFPIERKGSRSFYLTFSLNKLSQKYTYSLKGRRIEVPFPFEKPSSELDVCVITTEQDEVKLKELIKVSKDSKDLSEEEKSALQSFKRILTRQKVLKIYPGPKKKKDLSMLHDMFLVDTRLAESMPQTLGKYFLRGSKQFRSLRLIPKDFKFIPDYLPRKDATKPVVTDSLKEIVQNLKYTIECVYFYPRGSCATIKVGRMGMKEAELYENILQVIAGVASWLKESEGFDDILSVSLKTGDSISLPLYTTLPDLDSLEKDDKVKDGDKLARIMLKRKALRREKQQKRRKLIQA